MHSVLGYRMSESPVSNFVSRVRGVAGVARLSDGLRESRYTDTYGTGGQGVVASSAIVGFSIQAAICPGELLAQEVEGASHEFQSDSDFRVRHGFDRINSYWLASLHSQRQIVLSNFVGKVCRSSWGVTFKRRFPSASHYVGRVKRSRYGGKF